MKRTLIFILVIFTISLYAQPVENQSVLTIEQVMQGEKFVGYSPSGLFWSQDSQTAYFSWNPEMDTLNSMYKVSVDGGPPEKVGLEDEMALPSRFGTYSKDFRYYLYPQNGDLFLLDNNSGTTTQITNTLDRESNPVFSGDESAIIFTKSNNLYAWNRSSGVVEQLTQFKKGSERSSSSRSPEQKAWLEEQQMELFEILQERKAVRELRQARNETMQVERPLEIYYGGSSISDLQISPDMRFVTYRLTDQVQC
jgi:hypothetical protein